MKRSASKLSRLLLAGLLAASCAPALQARQQPSESAHGDSQKVSLTRIIWTNDNIVTLRKPWDDYLIQKGAAERASLNQGAQKASNKTAPSDAVGKSQFSPDLLPKTVAEAERMIKQGQEEIKYQEELIQKTREDLKNASENQGKGIQHRIDGFTTDLEASRRDLKTLQNRLQELKANAQHPKKDRPEANTQTNDETTLNGLASL